MTRVLQSSRFVVVLVIVIISAFAKAENKCPEGMDRWMCDLCGCATSSGSSGFGTLNNVSFVGVRYLHQSFESRDGIFSDSPMSTETINTYQLWSRIPISEKFYINAILPYQDLSRERRSENERLSGLGDAVIMGWYRHIFYKRPEGSDVVFENKTPNGFQMDLGLGIKLPTGRFEESQTNRINPGFQVGTGSWDGIASAAFSYGKNDTGINLLTTYYLKSTNKNDYRFGNQFSTVATVFHNIGFNTSSLTPFIGLNVDIYDSIVQFDETLPDTDGYIVQGSIGTEFAFRNYILGANMSIPVAQELFGGDVESRARATFYVNYVFD